MTELLIESVKLEGDELRRIRKSITHKRRYNKVMVTCECGVKVFGNSNPNVIANLKIHLTSKLHEKQVKEKLSK